MTPPPPANTAPVANNDSATATDTNPVTVNVLANDTDADGNKLTVTSTTQGAHGAVKINSDYTVTYTPSAPYTGTDSFKYTISDGMGSTATATVNLNLSQTPVTPPPVTPPPVDPPPVVPPSASTGTFTGTDIGNPTPSGSTVYDASTGTYTVTGGGTNIWGNADQFQYASQSLTGDGTIIARVGSMTDPHHFAKAGLMFRASQDPGSPEVLVTVTGSEGTGMYYRTTSGGTSANILAGDTSTTAPIWLKLVRSGSTFTGYKSSDGANWVKIGTVTVSMPQTIEAGLAVNSHNTTTPCVAAFDHVSLATTVHLTGTDIGGPTIAGSTSYNAATGAYTVSGAGANIWDTADQCQYAYQTMNGDGTIIAQINSFTYTHQFAKAGLMIRDSADPGAAQVMMALTGSNGTGMYYRSTDGGTSANILPGDTTQRAPVWVKLVRSGNTFTGYKSTDGVTWTQVAQVTVAMGSTVDVGLAVGSHDTSNLATATFSNVQILD